MNFDLRTCDAAYYFILDFMGMRPDEYIEELVINSENDFEIFWERNFDRIEKVDISDIRVMAFHILGSLDGCEEIKKSGLMNLQMVLTGDTIISRILKREGITFDIKKKTVTRNKKTYDIDYDHYRDRHFLMGVEEKLDRVAYRVFYDFCTNGFLVNDDVLNYGTQIHERPEFIMTLVELFPEVEKIEHYWRTNAESYRIDFYATIDQVHRFNFDLDEWRDPPYEGWLELNDDMKLKKWMLSHAIDRSNNDLSEKVLYIRDDMIIPPSQLLNYTKI